LVGTPQHWRLKIGLNSDFSELFFPSYELRLGKALEAGPNLFFTPSIKHNTPIKKKKTLKLYAFKKKKSVELQVYGIRTKLLFKKN